MDKKDCVIYKGKFFQEGKENHRNKCLYEKKGDKLPKSEKLIATTCRADYLRRFPEDKEEDEK